MFPSKPLPPIILKKKTSLDRERKAEEPKTKKGKRNSFCSFQY
jgi:hypothetical protein